MSILVNILVAILGFTLVFGGFVGWLVKCYLSRKQSVNNRIHTIANDDHHRFSCDRRVS